MSNILTMLNESSLSPETLSINSGFSLAITVTHKALSWKIYTVQCNIRWRRQHYYREGPSTSQHYCKAQRMKMRLCLDLKVIKFGSGKTEIWTQGWLQSPVQKCLQANRESCNVFADFLKNSQARRGRDGTHRGSKTFTLTHECKGGWRSHHRPGDRAALLSHPPQNLQWHQNRSRKNTVVS